MKKKYIFALFLLFGGKLFSQEKVRQFHDSIGFAKHSWQMDSIFSRIDSLDKIESDRTYKAVINPHDDYKYAGGLYAKTLSGIKADKIILIGVAHRARNFNLADKLIFGSYDSWESSYGNIKVSDLRNEILSRLKKESFIVHDSMMQLEHSLEAIIPFLQHQNIKTEIIPILIPYMKFEDMKALSAQLAEEFSEVIREQNLNYGEDIAVVISNDAIHYGSEDWGGSNLAPLGTDSIGNMKAQQKDLQIIEETLRGKLSNEKIKNFNAYTVEEDDYKAYKWTWCGRYSVPFGLLFANDLNKILNAKELTGEFIDYRSSLKNKHLLVEDLGMGVTAPAKPTHWVAYLGMGYQ